MPSTDNPEPTFNPPIVLEVPGDKVKGWANAVNNPLPSIDNPEPILTPPIDAEVAKGNV